MMIRIRPIIAATFLLLSGCQYYGICDLSSGKSYIANNWQMSENPWASRLKFKDARTGEEVTLRLNYQTVRLSEFEALQELGEPRGK